MEISQLRAASWVKEAIVADFHKALGQDMLEETLDEMLHRESVGFELFGFRRAVLKGEQGSLLAATVING